jgi:integrase/recombinase XerD
LRSIYRLQGKSPRSIITIFTKGEIKALQNACDSDVLGIRDKAMLAVYYGCGLRRNEGLNLDVNDILFSKNLLYVRKGKNYRERYVPMAEGVKEELQNYVDYARPILMKSPAKSFVFNRERGPAGKQWDG